MANDTIKEVYAEQRTLWDVVNDIGMGWFQVLAMLIGGAVFLVQGISIQILSMLTLSVSNSVGLQQAQSSSLTSFIFVGVTFGGLVSGVMADNLGRRLPLVLSLGALMALMLLAACAQNFGQLVALRLVFGFFYGMMGPVWTTMACEITPALWRMVLQGCSQLYFEVGELYAIGIVAAEDPQMNDLRWRLQMVISAIPPAVVFLAGLAFLEETPAFLALRGRCEDAKAVLGRMRRYNGQPDASLAFTPPKQTQEAKGTFRRQIGLLFGRQYLFVTLTLFVSHIVMNFVFYGNIYAFPQCLFHKEAARQDQAGVIAMYAVPDWARWTTMYGGHSGIVGTRAEEEREVQAVMLRRRSMEGKQHYFYRAQGASLSGFQKEMAPTASLAIGVLAAEIPAVLVSATLGAVMPRKVSMFLYLVVTAVGSLVFGLMVDIHGRSAAQNALFMTSYTVLRFSTVWGYVVLFQITAELYPTVVRATGCAVTFASGRIGSAVAPLVFEAMRRSGGRSLGYFVVCAALCVANIFPLLFVEETKGKDMQDTVEDDEPTEGEDERVPLKLQKAV